MSVCIFSYFMETLFCIKQPDITFVLNVSIQSNCYCVVRPTSNIPFSSIHKKIL